MTTTSTQAFGLERKRSVAESTLSDIYDLRIGEPKISPFPFEIFDELHQQKDINCYYPSHGDLELREMILSKYYQGFGVDNIGITHGTMGALDFIFRSTLDANSEILIPDPGFPPYVKMAEFSKGKVLRYELNLFAKAETMINWESVHSVITENTKILLINSPHNPTGKTLTKLDIASLVEVLNQYPNISFVLDEVYRELIYGKTHYDYSIFLDRGYIVGSFSKMCPLQGARIGWVLTNEKNMAKLSPYFNNATGAISSFGQEIVKSFLTKNISYEKNYKNAYLIAREVLDSFGVDYVIPEGAFFFFIKYNYADTMVTDELNDLGVGVVPGSVFGEKGVTYIRASFAQEYSILKNAFTIIGKHWREAHCKSLH